MLESVSSWASSVDITAASTARNPMPARISGTWPATIVEKIWSDTFPSSPGYTAAPHTPIITGGSHSAINARG